LQRFCHQPDVSEVIYRLKLYPFRRMSANPWLNCCLPGWCLRRGFAFTWVETNGTKSWGVLEIYHAYARAEAGSSAVWLKAD
jgi:hypothetical protein